MCLCDVADVVEAAGSRGSTSGRGDYYGALVVVGVVAALGALTSLLLLLVVVRRHRPHSVPITRQYLSHAKTTTFISPRTGILIKIDR